MKANVCTALLLAISMFFVGCTDNNDNPSLDGTGRLVVRMTDAPFPYEWVAEANVTVFKVEARKAEDDEMEDDAMEMGEASPETEGEESMEDTEDSPWVVLMEEEIPVNLLDLQNGVTQLLADAEVPAGTYNLVRIYVKGVNVVLTDGRSFDLKVPSGPQTGIKVFIKPPIAVTSGLTADLLLDFDISRSFVAKGNMDSASGISGFNFKPVIKASNSSTAGSLGGNVSYLEEELPVGIEGALVKVIAADTVNTSAFADADGNYMVMGLEAGAYKVLAEAEGFIASDTLDVEIAIANITTQDFVLEAEMDTTEETTEGGN